MDVEKIDPQHFDFVRVGNKLWIVFCAQISALKSD